MPKAIVIEQTGDRQTNQLQQTSAASTAQLRSGPFGNGNTVKNVQFTVSTPLAVNHGLGRTVQGFVVVNSSFLIADGPSRMVSALNPQPSGTDLTKTIWLQASTVLADIWFF